MRTVREVEAVLWLAEMGLSRRQITAVSGLPYNTVAKWLRGDRALAAGDHGGASGAFVRGLIHSDGSRFANPVTRRGRTYSYPRYFFANSSADVRAIFCEHLDLLEIAWRAAGTRNISIARRASVARLDEFVGPKR